MKDILALDYMQMHKLKAYYCDPWSSEPTASHFESLEDIKEGQVNYKGDIFVVTHKTGGGAGMGGYPPSTQVIKIEV